MRRPIVAVALMASLPLLLAFSRSEEGEETREPRHVALLIGISDYEHFEDTGPPGMTNLRGPANDIERMLKSIRRFRFVEGEDMLVLRDEQATLEGIREGFRWLASRADQPDDVVLIYYSGHGTGVRDLDGDESDPALGGVPGDTLDEALVPYDARDIHDPHQVYLDDYIREDLDRLGTSNVTIIIDACYSGTITRGVEEDQGLRRARGPQIPASGSGASGGGDFMANAQYTLITAASASQTALELPLGDEGRVYGLLTYNITKALDAAGPTDRYDDLMKLVGRGVASELIGGGRQTPQLEGDRGARIFRVRGDVPARAFALARPAGGGTVTLDVGAVHGVRPSAVYDVFGPGEVAFAGAPTAQVVVDSVHELRAFASVLPGGGAVEPEARATLARVPRGATTLETLEVYVDPSASEVRDAVASLPFVVLSDDPTADAKVTGRDGVYQVLSAGVRVAPEPAYARAGYTATAPGDTLTGFTASAEALCRPLARAFAITAFNRIENPTPARGLEIYVRAVPVGTEPQPRFDGADTLKIGERYDIYVMARVDPAAAAISGPFYLTAAISGYSSDLLTGRRSPVIFPRGQGANVPVPVNEWIRLLENTGISEPAGPERLKVVVGTDQFDLRTLGATLPRCDVDRGATKGRGDEEEDPWSSRPTPVTGWQEIAHELVIIP